MATRQSSSISTKTRRSQQDRRDEAEKALLDAAEELITRQGIEKASLAQIGELAGYSRGLVNHHFGSKTELLARLAERMQRGFAKSLQGNGDASGLTMLLTMVERYFRMKHKRGTRGGTFFLIWANAISVEDNRGFLKSEEAGRNQIKRMVQIGLDDGSITSNVNPESIALITISILRGIALQALIDPKHVSLLREKERVIQFLRDALQK